MGNNRQKFTKIHKNSGFLSIFFGGTCVNNRKYISRIFCLSCEEISLVSRWYDGELVEILVIVQLELRRVIDPPEKSKRRQRMPATKVAKKSIGMPEIRMKAKGLGINPGKMKKAELVHAIQVAEGCTPCFGTANGQCPYTDCCFMENCFKIKL